MKIEKIISQNEQGHVEWTRETPHAKRALPRLPRRVGYAERE